MGVAGHGSKSPGRIKSKSHLELRTHKKGGTPTSKDRNSCCRRKKSPFLAIIRELFAYGILSSEQKMCHTKHCAPAALPASHGPNSFAAPREPGESYVLIFSHFSYFFNQAQSYRGLCTMRCLNVVRRFRDLHAYK